MDILIDYIGLMLRGANNFGDTNVVNPMNETFVICTYGGSLS